MDSHLASDTYLASRAAEFERIPSDRRAELEALARLIAEAGRTAPLHLTFICTHNSRRSHLAQVWAQVAAWRVGLEQVHTWSGGTEATAFHPNAVAALDRAGLDVERADASDNPVYRISADPDHAPLRCFSKLWNAPENPTEDFVAVMTCDTANEACPLIPGARARVSLLYADPKEFDRTPREAAGYDERCAQIAREMLYAFERASAAT